MKEYPKGNEKLLTMISNGYFEKSFADEVLKDVDLNAAIADLNGFSTTYLYEAVDANNLQAVSYFLDHGADPNLYNEDLICRCALWELQYLWDDGDWKTRYEIAKLFFQHGADPNIECGGESLYDFVMYKIFNDLPDDENDFMNLRRLYVLLIVYGGGRDEGVYPKPRLNNVDRSRVDDYDVILIPQPDNYHLVGKLIDKDDTVVGDL